MNIITIDEKIIYNFEEWKKYCMEMNENITENQWQEDKSSYGLAKYWLTKGIEKIFEEYFTKKIGYKICFEAGIPEYEAKFDRYRNPRKHDFFIYTSDKKTLISIEAKSKEKWEDTFDEEYSNAKKIKSPSNKLKRCRYLKDHYFKGEIINDITYQIITWFAGSLADAEKYKSENIIMICQQFDFDCDTTRMNWKQLLKFVKIMNNKTKWYKYKIKYDCWDNWFFTTGPIINEYTKGMELYIIFLVVK